ncbi:MAG: branched-chain amino acid ABC transporter permease [Thermoproteota archaeon]
MRIRYDFPLVTLLIVVSSIFPLVEHGYWLHVSIITMYYMISALSWNLAAGFAGQFHFAQAAFSAVGAYASSLIALHMGLSPWITVWIGGSFACLIGFALGSISIRLRGSYLALSSIALSEITRRILMVEYDITRGALGLSTPPLIQTISKTPYYYIFLIILMVLTYLTYKLSSSKLGIALRAIREDPLAAETCGVDVTRVKVLAFTLSSFIAGLAGAFYAHYIGVISPDMSTILEAATIIAMVVIGGMGSIIGPIIGAGILKPMSEIVRIYGEYNLFIYALLVILILRFSPEGINGILSRVISKLSSYGIEGRENT